MIRIPRVRLLFLCMLLVSAAKQVVFERTEKGLVVLMPGKTSDELWDANVVKVLS